MAAGISTRNRATMEKSSLFVEVESLCAATSYPLRTPRLEDTVLDAHTREPITVITERYLAVLRFCRWSQPGHNLFVVLGSRRSLSSAVQRRVLLNNFITGRFR